MSRAQTLIRVRGPSGVTKDLPDLDANSSFLELEFAIRIAFQIVEETSFKIFYGYPPNKELREDGDVGQVLASKEVLTVVLEGGKRGIHEVIDREGGSREELETLERFGKRGRGESTPPQPVVLPFYLTKVRDLSPAWNRFAIGLGDILCGNYTRVFLSNYLVDLGWMFQECPRLSQVPVILCHGSPGPNIREKQREFFPQMNIFDPPLPIAYGTHHSKMVIAFYPEGVRVAVTTANFIYIDWNNKSQGTWIQDFPLKPANAESSAALPHDFGRDLVMYLNRVGGPAKDFAKELRRYDFSSANVKLVTSVPGYHKNEDLQSFGHLKLRSILSQERIDPFFLMGSEIVAQFSSFGSIKDQFIKDFTSTLMTEHSASQASSSSQTYPDLRLIWPRVEDVKASVEGWQGGGAIPCPHKNMYRDIDALRRNQPIWRSRLHKWVADGWGRTRAMPHIKTFLRYKMSPSHGSPVLAWMLLTSCNFSQAAWGQLQLMIRSYEVGVLFLPSVFKNLERRFSCTPNHPLLGTKQQSSSENGRTVEFLAASPAQVERAQSDKEEAGSRLVIPFPLPYSLPPVPYSDSDRPWCWDVGYGNELDAFGQPYPRG